MLPNGSFVHQPNAEQRTQCHYRGMVSTYFRPVGPMITPYVRAHLLLTPRASRPLVAPTLNVQEAFKTVSRTSTLQVDGDVYSDALVSLCNQRLHATILAEDVSFEIQHLVPDRSGGHPYIAYKLADYMPLEKAMCGARFPGADAAGTGHRESSL